MKLIRPPRGWEETTASEPVSEVHDRPIASTTVSPLPLGSDWGRMADSAGYTIPQVEAGFVLAAQALRCVSEVSSAGVRRTGPPHR